MKKSLIIASILIVGCYAQTQKLKQTEVPAAVKSKFNSMHPNVKGVKWEKEEGKYAAEFEHNNAETSILFDENGTFVQTEVEIPVSSLPKAIGEYVAKNVDGKKIKEASKITDAQGSITYEAEVGGEDYLFDANGNFLLKESEDEETEDED